jgi:hypothetical protein
MCSDLDIVVVHLPKEFVERLKKTAANEWSEDERDELYMDAVSCGNADDSFLSGESQGAASMASEILSYIGQ